MLAQFPHIMFCHRHYRKRLGLGHVTHWSASSGATVIIIGHSKGYLCFYI